MQKPLKSLKSIKIADESDVPIKIISGKFVEDGSSDASKILLAYGTKLRIVFETLVKFYSSQD